MVDALALSAGPLRIAARGAGHRRPGAGGDAPTHAGTEEIFGFCCPVPASGFQPVRSGKPERVAGRIWRCKQASKGGVRDQVDNEAKLDRAVRVEVVAACRFFERCALGPKRCFKRR